MTIKLKIVVSIIIILLLLIFLVFLYVFRPLKDADLTKFEWVVRDTNNCGLAGLFELTTNPNDHTRYQLQGKTILEGDKAIAVITRQYYFAGAVATIKLQNIHTKQMCKYADGHMSMIW